MHPRGLFKICLWIRMPKEGNCHEGSNNPYEIPKYGWVMKLV